MTAAAAVLRYKMQNPDEIIYRSEGGTCIIWEVQFVFNVLMEVKSTGHFWRNVDGLNGSPHGAVFSGYITRPALHEDYLITVTKSR